MLQCVKGYKIPFDRQPVQTHIPAVKFNSLKEFSDCKNEISKLLVKGAIRQCKPVPNQFISSYFLIPKPDGSSRFIFNLSELNQFIQTSHFKLEDIRTAKNLVTRHCFMASVDLEDAYLTVPVHSSCRIFLRFYFDGILYEWVVLPFGLNTAPYVFTKIMKPVVKYLRQRGVLSVIYIDDKLILGKTHMECQNNVNLSVSLLKRLGFLINLKKSELIPKQSCKFLGFILDSVSFTLKNTQDKIASTNNLLEKMLARESSSIEDFASLIGKLVSLCPATKYGWLYTKILEGDKFRALKSCNYNYKSSMIISNQAKKDMQWWLKNLQESFCSLEQPDFDVTIFTDASRSGWGAKMGDQEVFGFWNKEEQTHHINFLELRAVLLALESLANNLRQKRILLRIDNTTAISYINKMGGIQYENFNKLSREIWIWAEEREVTLYASYIKSADNVEADALSRIKNSDTEWALNFNIFNKISSIFGPPEIDLFASTNNKKCQYFVSHYPETDAYETDAFTLKWTKLPFYAFPPFAIILRVLDKIRRDVATGILVVPDWQNQAWFPLFKSMLIRDPVMFQGNNICQNSRNPRNNYIQGTNFIAGLVSGNVSWQEVYQKKPSTFCWLH